MLSPVLRLDWTLANRRGWLVLLRRANAAWLAGQFVWVFLRFVVGQWLRRHGMALGADMDRFTFIYVRSLVPQQFALLFLVTPVLVAGAITEEKGRGTLPLLFTAGLSSWDIVAGKLLARLGQLLLVCLAALPMLFFLAGLEQLDPMLILALVGVTVAPVFAVGALSMLASVWSKQTRDAVLATYAACALGYIAVWGYPRLHDRLAFRYPRLGLPLLHGHDALNYVDPQYVVTAWREPAEMGRRLLTTTLIWGGFGAACLGLAVWRLRPAYLRELEGAGRRPGRLTGRWLAYRRPVGDDPVYWREAHVEGLAPLDRLRRVPRWCGVVVLAAVTLSLDAGWHRESEFARQAVTVVLLAMLIVSLRSSGTITRERERQTWDAMRLTDLEARDIVRGKFHGVLWACLPYGLAYAVPALLVAARRGGDILRWTGLGLLVAVPIVYFVAAAGVWCSARSTSSWRSLLGTLALAYLGGSVLFCLAIPVTLMVTTWLAVIAKPGDGSAVWAAPAVLLAAVCYLAPYVVWGRGLLSQAEKLVRRNPHRTRCAE
jgi:hypothetical protein